MLNQTLEQSFDKSRSYERVTRAGKFSDAFKNIQNNKAQKEESLMYSKLAKYIKKVENAANIRKQEENNFIVEDPETIDIKIDFTANSDGLPFFKSINNKLKKLNSIKVRA